MDSDLFAESVLVDQRWVVDGTVAGDVLILRSVEGDEAGDEDGPADNGLRPSDRNEIVERVGIEGEKESEREKSAPERCGPVGAEDRFHADGRVSKPAMVFDRPRLLW
jgi:hypothetical protein